MKVTKLVLCGDGAVGKTTMASIYTRECRDGQMTVGSDFFVRYVEGIGTVVIWDIGGEKRFRFMAPICLRGASGVLYVFDLTRPRTLDGINSWISLVTTNVGSLPAILVGNKADIADRKVHGSEAEDFARQKGLLGYVETSALTGSNVDFGFNLLLRVIKDEVLLPEFVFKTVEDVVG